MGEMVEGIHQEASTLILIGKELIKEGKLLGQLAPIESRDWLR